MCGNLEHVIASAESSLCTCTGGIGGSQCLSVSTAQCLRGLSSAVVSMFLLPHPCRLFLSAEPPPALERGLPISLLQNSIKLTNEPPEGLRPNLRRAYSQFNEEILESCAKQVGKSSQWQSYVSILAE